MTWRKAVSIGTDLIFNPVRPSEKVGATGADGSLSQEGTQSNRQACRRPRPDAADDAEHVAGETRRRARSYISAGAKIREGHQSHRRQPAAADFPHSPGPRCIFL